MNKKRNNDITTRRIVCTEKNAIKKSYHYIIPRNNNFIANYYCKYNVEGNFSRSFFPPIKKKSEYIFVGEGRFNKNRHFSTFIDDGSVIFSFASRFHRQNFSRPLSPLFCCTASLVFLSRLAKEEKIRDL